MRWKFVLVVFVSMLFLGCSEEDIETTASEGWHFQGRDCLSCHNSDLKEDKSLLVGGTLFRSSNVSDIDDMSQVCGGDFVINFLDSSYATQISSKDYENKKSAGYNAKGNIFIISKYLDTINGDYYVQIADRESSKTLAISGVLHSFNGSYSNANSSDDNNRNTCNSCHIKGGTASPIYVQVNKNLCE